MDLAIRALNLDATDFINKPIQRSALEQALNRARERIELARSQESQVALDLRAQAAVVHIRGSVTSHSESALQQTCGQAFSSGKSRVILDFDPHASVNGAGIAILTQILMEGQKQAIPVAISGLSDNFSRVFKIVGISNLAQLFDTLEAALGE
jgi:anti-anti-sigma factor